MRAARWYFRIEKCCGLLGTAWLWKAEDLVAMSQPPLTVWPGPSHWIRNTQTLRSQPMPPAFSVHIKRDLLLVLKWIHRIYRPSPVLLHYYCGVRLWVNKCWGLGRTCVWPWCWMLTPSTTEPEPEPDRSSLLHCNLWRLWTWMRWGPAEGSSFPHSVTPDFSLKVAIVCTLWCFSKGYLEKAFQR
jgi:hypothetical protein